MNKLKVLLLQGNASPYRLPLFDSLSGEVDLQVIYCKYRPRRRKWDIPINEFCFKYRVLKCLNMGPFMINPGLIFYLFSHKFDAFVISDDVRVVFSAILIFIWAKLLGRPVTVWSGATERAYYEKYKILIDKYMAGPLNKLIYRNSDSFIAYGQETENFLVNRGVPQKNIFKGTQVICSKQLEHQRKISENQGVSKYKEKKIILCISYFDKRKGINFLIDAYKKLKTVDTALIIAGAGKEEENLKRQAGTCKSIYFPGYVQAKEKAYYYSIADIFILPTLSDAWGLVVNEAMMFGLPIIVTNEAGCAKELINGNGSVVKAESCSDLEEAIGKLLDDDKLRQTMGKRSLEIISGYTIGKARTNFTDAINFALR